MFKTNYLLKIKRWYKSLCLLFYLLGALNLFAQTDSTKSDTIFDGHVVSSDWIDHGVCFGIDFSKYLYGDINYFKSYIWEVNGFPALSTTMTYGLEISYLDKVVLAPKIQGRIHAYFFNTSLSALCYSHLNQDFAIKLRPEIGIGLWNIDINYGYNIGIYKKGFDQYNKHVVILRYYLKLYRKHLNEYDGNGNIKPIVYN